MKPLNSLVLFQQHYSRDDVLRQLMILEELRKKKVITRKEYKDKRKIFLDDLV